VGPLGHSQRVKLLNNLLFAANLMNAAELVRMAGSWGLDTAKVAQVIQTCSGASYAMNLFTQPRTVEAAMEGARRYMIKDVGVIAQTAKAAGLDISAFAPTVAYYREE
jgi:3-hydroxyisobutyrate dehydrogenase-like beta-hydroxyacid dehydrogenase